QYEAKLAQAAPSGPQALARVAQQDLKGNLLQALKESPLAPSRAELTQTALAREALPRAALVLAAAANGDDVARTDLPKGQAAQTTNFRGDSPAPASTGQNGPEGLAGLLTNHLQHIESQQALNLLARSQGEPFQLQIPFFNGQQMSTAFLSIEPE